MTAARERSRDDTAPCVGCGLCCDGRLYVRAQIKPGEESRMLEFGLELVTHEEMPFFRQPCPHHACGRCAIYDQRYHVCRSYRCKLLRRYHDGEIDLREARATIKGAMDLLEQLKSEGQGADLSIERVRFRRELDRQLQDPAHRDRRKDIARGLLNMVAADEYLDRWFRDEPSNRESVIQTHGETDLRIEPKEGPSGKSSES